MESYLELLPSLGPRQERLDGKAEYLFRLYQSLGVFELFHMETENSTYTVARSNIFSLGKIVAAHHSPVRSKMLSGSHNSKKRRHAFKCALLFWRESRQTMPSPS